MPQTRNTVTLHGTPLRIWSALVDRDQRRAWGPLIELDATDRRGKTESSFFVNGWSRPLRTPASVDRLDKPRCFAWSCGLRFVFELEERFELSGDDGGTLMTHSVAVKGALGYLFASFMLGRLRLLVIEADERFATYLRWRVGRSAPGNASAAWTRRGKRKAR